MQSIRTHSLPVKKECIDDRQTYLANRCSREKERLLSKHHEGERKYFDFFSPFIRSTYRLLKHTGLIDTLRQETLKPVVRVHDLYFPDLPPLFHGYTILHLSDFHLDRTPEIAEISAEILEQIRCDIAIFTGDYQDSFGLNPYSNRQSIRTILSAINSRDGLIVTLGNHDSYKAVQLFEEEGARVLINESFRITRGIDSLTITGLDDVHYFYSENTLKAMQNARGAFKILAVHSPEMYDHAHRFGYRFYLCGHTHGGQICLPGGRAIVNGNHHIPRPLTRGCWAYHGLRGYTNVGLGTSTIPLRWNCPPEIAVLKLKRTP